MSQADQKFSSYFFLAKYKYLFPIQGFAKFGFSCHPTKWYDQAPAVWRIFNPGIRFLRIPGSGFWKNPGIPGYRGIQQEPAHTTSQSHFFSIILEAKLLIRGKRLGKMVQMSYVEGCWHQNWGCSRPTDDFTITTHKICIFHKTGRTRKLSMCFFLHEEYPRHLTPFPSITSNCQVWRRFQNRVLFLDPTLIYENQPPLWHWAHQHSIKNTSRSQCPTLFLAVHASTGSI